MQTDDYCFAILMEAIEFYAFKFMYLVRMYLGIPLTKEGIAEFLNIQNTSLSVSFVIILYIVQSIWMMECVCDKNKPNFDDLLHLRYYLVIPYGNLGVLYV